MKDISIVTCNVPIVIRDNVISFHYRHESYVNPGDKVNVGLEGMLKFSGGKALVQITKPYLGTFVEFGAFEDDSESNRFFGILMAKLAVEWGCYRDLERSFKYIEENFTGFDRHACELASKYSKFDWISDEEFNASFDEYLDMRERGVISKEEYDEKFYDKLDKMDTYRKIIKAFSHNFIETCPEYEIETGDINKLLYLRRKMKLDEPVVLSDYMAMWRESEKIWREESYTVGIFYPLREEFIVLLKTNKKELIL